MSRALTLFRFIELLLGIPLALRVLMNGNNDWGILYFLFLYVAITAVFFVTPCGSSFSAGRPDGYPGSSSAAGR